MTNPITVYEMFLRAVSTAGEQPFLMIPSNAERAWASEGATFTYSAAHDQVESLASGYRDAGYGPGRRVALVLGNRPEYFWHFLALNALGACAVPLNPELLEHEFVHALGIAGVSLVVTAAESATTVHAAAENMGRTLPVVELDAALPALPPPALPADPAAAAQPREHRPALVIFTSGTTSRPKGCVISNFSCLASGKDYTGIGGLMTLEPDVERLYNPLPAFHMNLTVLSLNAVLQQRGCLITTDRFRASTWWQELRETSATCLHYLGLIPPILLKTAPSPDDGAPTVKYGLGAGVDPALHRDFEQRYGFPLVECWGMTETSRLIANAHEPRHLDTRAIGRPLPPWEVMVADENGAAVSDGAPGEFLVRCEGPDPRSGFFSEYINDPDATAAAWQDGWFHTGDVVIRDADGMLYFVERRKNIIRRSGENIAAAEIEEAIIDDPSVSRVVVMAVPDELRDEEPLACVVLANGVAATAATARTLMQRARDRLALHKLPGWVQFVDTIPLTPTQKPRKDVLLSDFRTDDPRTVDVRPLKSRRAPSYKARGSSRTSS